MTFLFGHYAVHPRHHVEWRVSEEGWEQASLPVADAISEERRTLLFLTSCHQSSPDSCSLIHQLVPHDLHNRCATDIHSSADRVAVSNRLCNHLSTNFRHLREDLECAISESPMRWEYCQVHLTKRATLIQLWLLHLTPCRAFLKVRPCSSLDTRLDNSVSLYVLS